MGLRLTPQMTLVAYFLSRCGAAHEGKRVPGPPATLGVETWSRAYAMFYGKLGAGRTWTVFRNSLKNARDDFDSHTPSGRVGWREKGSEGASDRPPRPLPLVKQRVIDHWESRSDEELWNAVKPFVDQAVQSIGELVLADLAAELDPEPSAILLRTEGGLKVIVSIRVERDPTLRAAALAIHGTKCSVCGLSFEDMYGEWGKGFAVVHHLQPLAAGAGEERSTDPASDLAVLCANCHCMVHRKKGVVLTLEELKRKLLHTFKSEIVREGD